MRALRKSVGLLLAFTLVVSVAAAAPAIKPAPAQAGIIPPLPSPCNFVPDGAARTACKVVTNPVAGAGIVAKAVGIPTPSDVVNDVAQAIVAPIVNQLARLEADAVLTVLKDVSNFVNNSTAPDLTADWFLHLYGIIFGIAAPIGAILFWGRIAAATKNLDPGDAATAFVKLMAVLTLGGLIPGLVGLGVNYLDNTVAPMWMSTAGADANGTVNNLSVSINQSLSLTGVAGGILLTTIELGFGIIAGFLLELMMLFREAMLYLVTGAEMIACVLLIGGQLGLSTFISTTRKLAVLMLFKVIVAFILTVGVMLLGSDSAKPVLLGVAVLAMVPLLSWGAYRNWSGHDIQFMPGAMGRAKQAYGYASGLLTS